MTISKLVKYKQNQKINIDKRIKLDLKEINKFIKNIKILNIMDMENESQFNEIIK